MADELIIEQLQGGDFTSNRIRFLVYGESGVGKTRFACTWPRPIVVDADDGLASVDWAVDRIRVNHWENIFAVLSYLDSEEAQEDYNTVVVDSLNELQTLALDYVVEQFPGIRRPYDSLASQSDYGKMLNDFDDVIRRFKALPYNLVLVGQVGSRQYEDEVIIPQLVGKHTARNVCRMMDEVGYMYRDGGEVSMGFNMEMFTSKDRSGVLPEVVEEPSYEKLAEIWVSKRR